ncbi:MAG: Succinyl-diaminopimelate desuccinylase [Pseudomonadota bacterium]|jgi:succinyl-diaminopimelate desuccinylase
MMRPFVEEAKKILSLPAITHEGNEEVANYAAGLMRARGMKVQLQQVTHSLEDVSKRQFNVIGISGDPLVDRKTRKGLLLLSHLDTSVPGLFPAWTECAGKPMEPHFRDGWVYGLGAAQGKLDFLCKLHAIEKYREKKLKMPIYLVGTCGEKLGMFGAKYLMKSMALNPRYVLVGGASNLAPVYRHKCEATLRVSIAYHRVTRDARGFNRQVIIEAFGRQGHAAFPELGENAILQLLEFLKGAQDAGFDFRFTGFSGGHPGDMVADRAQARLFLTSHQLEDFKLYFEDYRRRVHRENQLSAITEGFADAGVQFFPDPLFPAICDVVASLGFLSEDLAEKRNSEFEPPISTLNLERMVERPGSIDLWFNAHLIPEVSIEDLESQLKSALKALSVHYPALNFLVHRDRLNPALSMTDDQALAQHCEQVVGELGWSTADAPKDRGSIASEAAHYFQGGYEAVVFGPGRAAGNVHAPNERNSLTELEGAVRFYERLIERVCL